MADLLHKLLYTGIGFAVMTEEKARDLVVEMEKRGEVSREEGSKLAQEMVDKAREHADHLRETVADEVDRLSSKFMWVTREDFDALKQRVETLEERLAAAGGNPEA